MPCRVASVVGDSHGSCREISLEPEARWCPGEFPVRLAWLEELLVAGRDVGALGYSGEGEFDNDFFVGELVEIKLLQVGANLLCVLDGDGLECIEADDEEVLHRRFSNWLLLGLISFESL